MEIELGLKKSAFKHVLCEVKCEYTEEFFMLFFLNARNENIYYEGAATHIQG